MKYYVQRQLNEYGPYTLADLQRYIAQGNILLTDLTRSEGMTDWVPVSQVIGNIPIPVPPAPIQIQGSQMYGGSAGSAYGGAGTVYGGAPVYGGLPAASPANGTAPPDLHWVLLLVTSIITCSLFAWAWLFVEAVYIRKIKSDSKGLVFSLLAALALFMAVFVNMISSPELRSEGNPLSGLLMLASLILYFVGIFQMQSDLEAYYNTAEPIHLQLNGAMTFFCGIFYFQYQFSRINEWKRTGYLQPQG